MSSMDYIQPLFRPPSEAGSLILQVTNGCSWNHCAFCEMYTAPQKKFNIKKQSQIETEIQLLSETCADTRRIFLADGDAMVLSTRRLLHILSCLKKYFPNLNRVSAYCLPRNLRHKTQTELNELHDAGLQLAYIGAESGDDELLKLIDKGETFASIVSSVDKLNQAKFKTSVMLLNGLGGKTYSQQHAMNSACLINEIQPTYLATLVISFPLGEKRFVNHFPNGFQMLDQQGLFHEMEVLLQNTELHNTIFRSDHASNYLTLKGVLGRDKQKLIDKLQLAQNHPSQVHLRQEWQRGL
ncbi:MAG: radical SAM protein [Gammaproteobacteria bacterium]|nr:radical SAM protein [Gammaproteobacteria bacterium]